MKEYKSIGEILKTSNLLASPLAGITNRAFRKIVRMFHKGLIFTEMISVEGLKRLNPKTVNYLSIDEEDYPIGIQLFGNNPESFYNAIQICDEKYGNLIFSYDVNMGCPVKKVLKSGGGSALLGDIENIKRISKSIRKSTKKPVSLKIRLGLDQSRLVYNDILQIASDEGIDFITIHARTRADLFNGLPRYDLIADAVKKAKIPIIGNGNITSNESLNKMIDTGVQGVMIGRGMMNMPWIFAALQQGKEPINYLYPAKIFEILKLLEIEELKLANTLNMQSYNLDILKKYAVIFSKNLEGATKFRGDVYGSSIAYQDFWELAQNFYLKQK